GEAAGPAVGRERELADAVGPAGLLHLLVGQADAGDLRPGVDDAGDGVVIDVTRLAGQSLREGDALVLGLVGEHRPGDQVADGVDTGHVRLIVLVHGDPAAPLFEGDAGFL